MGVKQTQKAFSGALKKRSFSVLNNTLQSADGNIKVVFEGSTWSLYIGSDYMGDYPMEGGSIEKLKKLLARQGLKLPDRLR